MKENDNNITYQLGMNLLSKEPTLVNHHQDNNSNPIKLKNQIDNPNQPLLVKKEDQLPIETISLSEINSWGSIPHEVTCPFCHKKVVTSVEENCNMASCCLCFWLSCIIWAAILYCTGKEIGCVDAIHKCPNCKNVIGVYHSC